MASNLTQSTTIRVLTAGTGVTYKITLPLPELTVSNIRSHLAGAVPPGNQILLLGPPYKVPKNSTLQSEEVLNALRLGDMEDDPIQEDTSVPRTLLPRTERSGAKRLFLFSKLYLSENAPDPPLCSLEPKSLILPTAAPEPSPLNINPHGAPPLHLPLYAFERQFMLYMSQGRVLADGADLRLAACRTCVLEHAVMASSLRAAVSNLSDHYHGAARTRAEFTAQFQAKSVAHGGLLQRFESIMSNLGNTPLHPSLVTVARTAGRTMETLLDTTPVERERAWAAQCQNSHQRLLALFGELDTAFKQLGTPTSREEDARRDRGAEEDVNVLWAKVEGTAREIRDRQGARLNILTNVHRDAVQTITHAINSHNDDEVQGAFAPLGAMSSTSKDSVAEMMADDEQLKQLMASVGESKNVMMKRMKVRLREVSVAQSSIQKVLSSVGVLRDALSQQTENMIHLEHVEELQISYRAFLSELQRRRAYGNAVAASSTAMLERLAAMREDEVKCREKFLRGPGRHLMPAFFDIFVPTLATPPPLFTPQLPAMVELDTLPHIDGPVESNSESPMQQSTAAQPQATGSASSLTTESHPTPQQSETMMTSTALSGQAPTQDQNQLIVSADEGSGDGIIVDPAAATAVEAEAKTLAYENIILRQALERQGGKPPRTYIDEAREKDGTTQVNREEIEALRKELEKAKSQLALTKLQMAESNKLSDKISHSSFNVGDVGLFMPTGRGTGGKRSPDFVLGRIVYQEELIAGEIGTDANPYGLHVGTMFWVLTVEVLKSSQ